MKIHVFYLLIGVFFLVQFTTAQNRRNVIPGRTLAPGESVLAGNTIVSAEETAATNHTISVSVEITETAINRFLQDQYNKNEIPQTVTGSLNGLNYTFLLSPPQVELLQDVMKLRMSIQVNSNIGNSSIIIEPTLNVPAWSISASNILTTFSNLSSVINTLSLDSRIKIALINAYNSLNLVMYPSQLATQLSSSLFAQQSIKFVDPILSVQSIIIPGAIKFILSTYLSSSIPTFWTSIDACVGDDHIYFKTNLQVKVKEIIILQLGGSTVLYHGYPDMISPKSLAPDQYIDINIGDIGIGSLANLIIKVRYQNDNTWYSRTYPLVIASDPRWFGATESIN